MAQSNNNSVEPSLVPTPDGLPATGADMLPSGLKPKLDLIFSEVEKKLPDIDFDVSDVSKMFEHLKQ